MQEPEGEFTVRYVIHKHAAWFALAATFCCGASFGALVVVVAVTR